MCHKCNLCDSQVETSWIRTVCQFIRIIQDFQNILLFFVISFFSLKQIVFVFS